MAARMNRRIFGMLSKRLDEAGLGEVADERDDRGKRWQLGALLRAALGGMLAGAKAPPLPYPKPSPSPLPLPKPTPPPGPRSRGASFYGSRLRCRAREQARIRVPATMAASRASRVRIHLWRSSRRRRRLAPRWRLERSRQLTGGQVSGFVPTAVLEVIARAA